MSDHELPDDVALWPDNPFQLLGVRHGDDPKEIKRAYTRLIRRFKPEHYPEQFRRLREAYEAITAPTGLTDADWVRFEQLTEPEPPHGQRDWQDSPSNHAHRDVFQTLWQQAKEGQIDSVLKRLCTGDWQAGELARARLMQYWLTKLNFPATSDAVAGKILAENLHCFARMPQVLAIARHELYLHPELAEHIDLEKCFEQFFTAEEVEEVVRMRWDAALRVWNFGLIRNDYESLTMRFFENRAARETVSILAIDRLIWSSYPEDVAYTQRIVADLEATSGLRRERWADFDRLDYLMRLHNELVHVSAAHGQWQPELQMVRCMWNGLEEDFLKTTCAWLVDAFEHSAKALAFFDCILPAETLGAFWVAHFERAIRHFALSDAQGQTDQLFTLALQWQAEPPSEFEVALVEDFLGSYNQEPYDRFRVRTVEFCVREQVPVQKIIHYVKESESRLAEFFQLELVGMLIMDRSLHTLLGLLEKMALVTSLD